MRLPAIPLPDPKAAHAQRGFDFAVKENLEYLRGQRGGRIEALSPAATLDEVIAKINEMLTRQQL